MSCSSCVSKIEKALLKAPGIIEANIILTLNCGKIKYNQSQIGIRNIIEIIEKIGYKAMISNDESKIENMKRIHSKQKKKWRNSFIFSAIFGVLSMVVMFVFMYGLPPLLMKKHHHANHSNTTKNDMETTHKMKMDHSEILVLVPGLNLEVLLLFILCTPVQVINFNYKQDAFLYSF